MVVGHVSRPYVEAVHCRRLRFPDRRCTSLEHSVAGRSLIQFFYLHSSVGWRLSFSCEASLTKFVNFRYIVRWPRSFGLFHPNIIRSIYLFYLTVYACISFIVKCGMSDIWTWNWFWKSSSAWCYDKTKHVAGFLLMLFWHNRYFTVTVCTCCEGAPTCPVAADVSQVSGRHCRFWLTGEEWWHVSRSCRRSQKLPASSAGTTADARPSHPASQTNPLWRGFVCRSVVGVIITSLANICNV